MDFIPFSLPWFGQEEKDEICKAIDSGWVTTGPKTKEFEKQFAEYVGASHAIAVHSCTGALHLSLLASGIREGDEVITSPLTFAATANTVIHSYGTPVFVDIRKDTYNIDEKRIEEKITSRTRAILPVHYGGQPCEMGRIRDIAALKKLKIVEDAAHAAGAEYKGGKIGSSSGSICCFSFYANKNMTTGEGGMITTSESTVEEYCRINLLHGISKDAWKRYTASGSWYYEVVNPGFKYNMTDLQAALGIHQLKKLDGFIEKREIICGRYDQAFGGRDEFIVPEKARDVRHARHLYPLLINPAALAIDRNRFIDELKQRNIGTSVHFIPLILQPYYKNRFKPEAKDYPNTLWFYEREISIPLFPRMTEEQVTWVIDGVLDIAKKFKR